MNVIAFMRLSLIVISEILNLELFLNNKLHKQHHFAFQTLNDNVRIFLKQSSSNLNSFILAHCHVNLLIRHVVMSISRLKKTEVLINSQSTLASILRID